MRMFASVILRILTLNSYSLRSNVDPVQQSTDVVNHPLVAVNTYVPNDITQMEYHDSMTGIDPKLIFPPEDGIIINKCVDTLTLPNNHKNLCLTELILLRGR